MEIGGITRELDLIIGGPVSEYDDGESELLYARSNEEYECALFSTGAIIVINWEFVLAYEDQGKWMEFAVFEGNKCLIVKSFNESINAQRYCIGFVVCFNSYIC